MNDETNTLVSGVLIFVLDIRRVILLVFSKCFKSNEACELMDVFTNLTRNILLYCQIKYKLYNNA